MAIRNRWKIVVKRTNRNILIKMLLIFIFLQIGIFSQLCILIHFAKNSFKAVKAVVNFLGLMFQRTCCVFFILFKNRHSSIHQLLNSFSSLKTFYLFSLLLYFFILLEFEQFLISQCFSIFFWRKETLDLFKDLEECY